MSLPEQVAWSALSWNPWLQSHLNPPSVLKQSCSQLFVPRVHSLSSIHVLPSLDSVNPLSQLHTNDPAVLVQPWSQPSVFSSHSSISVKYELNMQDSNSNYFNIKLSELIPEHVLWSAFSLNPRLHSHMNPPGVLEQSCSQLCAPVIHSFTSIQVLPSAKRV